LRKQQNPEPRDYKRRLAYRRAGFCQNEIVKLCTPLTLKGGFNFNDLKAIIAENRNGSGQVSSKKAYFKQPTIATIQNAHRSEWLKYVTFWQNKNHLPIKFLLSIDGV
jgi:hypothetical protein